MTISGHVRRALDSYENYNLLLCGPPASAKTLLLVGILECRNGVYFDGSNSTNRIPDVLEQERPKVICIDELDKMPRTFQNQLLNFGWISAGSKLITKILKIHGDLNHPNQMIVTEEEFDRYAADHPLMSTYISNLFVIEQPRIKTNLRVAWKVKNKVLRYDLANTLWQQVQISSNDIRILDSESMLGEIKEYEDSGFTKDPVFFQRYSNSQEQVLP